MKLHLQGLADYTEGEEYKLEFGDLPEEHNDNIMKWLAIDPKKNTLSAKKIFSTFLRAAKLRDEIFVTIYCLILKMKVSHSSYTLRFGRNFWLH